MDAAVAFLTRIKDTPDMDIVTGDQSYVYLLHHRAMNFCFFKFSIFVFDKNTKLFCLGGQLLASLPENFI